ncbi:helix-turn-helix protein [Pseudovibrio sp. W64]|uniref:helix-turn-helix domain-containing protein n=1 Tax=unclassified Pseudovibrio TaxID=2627060 RepID=UPI0007AE605C|nr:MULTISPECIES: helix-turn-helix transcriptional regulator [unclassified Pseudovibrio]KZK80191.1 helix-turn-helix protein [Pseudovibrio sp. W64]KZK83106.1 helix-turn-helix protein [Pseudovibrio sp. Ad13]
MTWQQRLQKLRKQNDLTVKDLARRANVGYDNLYKIEKGLIDNPRGDTLGKLALALGVNEQFLRFGIHGVNDVDFIEDTEILSEMEGHVKQTDLDLIDQAWTQALEIEAQVYGSGSKGPMNFVSMMFARIYHEMLKRNEQ